MKIFKNVFLSGLALSFFLLSSLSAYNLAKEKIEIFSQPLNKQSVKLILNNKTTEIMLNGQWKYRGTDDEDISPVKLNDFTEWAEMDIPSNWFLMGKKNYPDRGQGLDYHGTVWFAATFDFPKEYQGKCLTLYFNMVDYYADVFLNGSYAGSHKGYFQKFAFNIEDKLKYGEKNILLVRVNSPQFIIDRKEDYDRGWPLRQYVIKGVFSYHDTRPGGTSDHGQDHNTGGIIGDVSIKVTDAVRLDKLLITTDLGDEQKSAALTIKAVIYNALKTKLTGDLALGITPANFQKDFKQDQQQAITLDPGLNIKEFSVKVKEPNLWWPWDYGSPDLYYLSCSILKNKKLLDQQKIRFGIRTFQRGPGWKCYINEKEIRIRGSNYISSQWLSEMDHDKYLKDVQLMKEANLNSIRVHAHVEKDEFYDLCDEYGLLVWQDFPLQWGYTDDELFQKDAETQIEDMVNKLFNHASIIIWCGHNESPWACGWIKKKDPEQNRKLDERLKKKVEAIDNTRYMHMNSGVGDAHDYSGWYVGTMSTFRSIPGKPFITEFGAQALPVLDTMKKMFTKDELMPKEEKHWQKWAYHNFQKDLTFKEQRVRKSDNIDDLIRRSQQYQAKLIKFAVENYRRAQEDVYGLYHFMFTDCWPSITWSVLDYYRNPKLGFSALKTAMQPLLPSIEYDSLGNFYIWIVNDQYKTYIDTVLKWEFLNRVNKVIYSKQVKVIIPELSSKKIEKLHKMASSVLMGNGKLNVWIEDKNKNIIARNSLSQWEWIDVVVDEVTKYMFKRANATSEVQPAHYAIDGNLTTCWESIHDRSRQELLIQLEEKVRLNRVTIQWTQAAAKTYRVFLSKDGKMWTIVENVTDGLPGEKREIPFFVTKARYIKIVCLEPLTDQGYAIWEVDFAYKKKAPRK